MATSMTIPTYQSANAMPHTQTCIKPLGRQTQSMAEINRYICRYRGTQPHSRESTNDQYMFGVRQCQSAAVNFNQYTNNIIDKKCRSLPVKHQCQSVSSNTQYHAILSSKIMKRKSRSLPVTTDVGGAATYMR